MPPVNHVAGNRLIKWKIIKWKVVKGSLDAPRRETHGMLALFHGTFMKSRVIERYILGGKRELYHGQPARENISFCRVMMVDWHTAMAVLALLHAMDPDL